MNTSQIKQLWEESVTHMNTSLYSNSLHFLLWGQLYIRQNGLWVGAYTGKACGGLT